MEHKRPKKEMPKNPEKKKLSIATILMLQKLKEDNIFNLKHNHFSGNRNNFKFRIKRGKKK